MKTPAVLSLLALALPLIAGSVPTGDDDARRIVAPRSELPPAETDPLRPPHLRQLKPGVWTDDAGVDDFGNPYNQYRRSAFGTWSNYDESLANPFPLTEPLRAADSRAIATAADWWQFRRPEIFEAFRSEIYGRVPAAALPEIRWESAPIAAPDGAAGRQLVGRIGPAGGPEIHLQLTLPVSATGPMPVIVHIGASHSTVARDATLARGWAYAVFDPTSLQPDNSDGLRHGIIGLLNHGEPRQHGDAWGALSAWAWGLSRVIDHLENDRDIDARRLGLAGHSRWGKTALWAAAQDPRWAVVFSSCSGQGGAKPSRRNFGETTDNLAASHWMATNFRKYGGNWDALPVDAPELIALIAPRPVFVTGATQDPWADPRGEFLTLVAAGPVYRLLGARDLGTTEMPAPGVSLVAGELAFREHIGGHVDTPDWPVFLEFAARYLVKSADR